MEEMENDKASSSYSWWWESHESSTHEAQWLDFTLSDLDKKTKAMLTLIQEGDGDSTAQRAELYYKKRLELVRMVEDFHRSYRSLAERYHQLSIGKNPNGNDNDYYSQEELPHSNPESTVEDPGFECDANILNLDFGTKPNDGLDLKETPVPPSNPTGRLEIRSARPSNFEMDFELSSLLEEENKPSEMGFGISRLFQELVRGNEEKREAIKELHSQLDKLMDENKALQKTLISSVSSRQNPSQISRLKGLILGKLHGVGP